MIFKILSTALCAALFAGHASAATVIDGSTFGYYNDSLGNIFPVSDDATVSYPVAPTFTGPGVAELGDWLGANALDVLDTDPDWEFGFIPSSWTVGDETAVVYKLDLAQESDLKLSIGVDNGVFVWVDGAYQFGARASGGASLGEYMVSIPNLAAGTRLVQILREDHGGGTGFLINGDLSPAAMPTVPLPAAAPMLVAGLAALGFMRRRRRT